MAARGDIVLVTFYDHVEDGDEPMLCHVAGRLKYKGAVREVGAKRRRFLVVESWWTPDEEVNEGNAKVFTILVSTVERVEVLRSARTGEPPRHCKGPCSTPPEGSPES